MISELVDWNRMPFPRDGGTQAEAAGEACFDEHYADMSPHRAMISALS